MARAPARSAAVRAPSAKRPVAGRAPSARAATRKPERPREMGGPRVSWSRRIGMTGGLLLLVGASIAVAAEFNRGHTPARVALVSHAAATEPTLDAPTADNSAPQVRLTQPNSGDTVLTPTVTLQGRTDPDASIDVVAEAGGGDVRANVGADGHFDATVPLKVGDNWFVLKGMDAAGNTNRARIHIVRAPSRSGINLTVSPTQIALTDLPASVQISAAIDDDEGHPADGAQVTFGLSPPNQGTTTYQTTSSNGHTSWPDLVIQPAGQVAGEWRVTVFALLPSGTQLRADGSFSLQ